MNSRRSGSHPETDGSQESLGVQSLLVKPSSLGLCLHFFPSKRCMWALHWVWPGYSCTSVRLMAVPVLSVAWPGTHTVLGMALPVPATAPALANAGSVGRTYDMATLLCSVWARARAKTVSGGPWNVGHPLNWAPSLGSMGLEKSCCNKVLSLPICAATWSLRVVSPKSSPHRYPVGVGLWPSESGSPGFLADLTWSSLQKKLRDW